MSEQNTPKCPWCCADLIHFSIGSWRCPHCTGYFSISKKGDIKRLRSRPLDAVDVITTLFVIIVVIALFAK